MRHIKMFRAALAAFVTVVLTSQSLAADIFVSPTGSGDFSGSSWSNAINGNEENLLGIKVRTAITDAVAADAEEVNVYFASGDYVTTNQITLSSITIPVKLSGGYVGETDGSFDRSETATTFKRSTYNIRFISATSLSSFAVEGITFSGGCINVAAKNNAAKGGAIHLNSSIAVISNCVFFNNCVKNASASGQIGQNGFAGGGAVAVDSGDVNIVRCEFSSNYITGQNKNNSSGGAVFAKNANMMIVDCNFDVNYMDVNRAFNYNFGGAIATYFGNVSIRRCSFTGNYGRGSSSAASSGGALAIRNARKFSMSDCYFSKCYVAQTANGTGVYSAGIALLDDMLASDGVMTSVVERCVFDSMSVPNTIKNASNTDNLPAQSDIAVFGGRLFMTNCVISSTRGNHSYSSYSIRCRTGSCSGKQNGQGYDSKQSTYTYYTAPTSMELVNCTIADGKLYGAAAQTDDAELILKNCIVSGHSLTGVVNATSIEHSYIQANNDGTWNYEGEGNLNPNQVGDINWTGAPYYHLLTKNANGAITNGWFSGTFESPKCAADSPCIDAGAPGSIGLDLEPYYSGRRVNIGAYGGTPWASKTSPIPGFKLIIR